MQPDDGLAYSKNNITRRKVQQWVIPPKSNAESAARMDQVLDIYALPYIVKVTVIVMEEQPVRLFKEVRQPIPATRHHAKRIDYEYERAGAANIFMFAEPLGSWRMVSVRDRKTKIDWAHEVRHLLEVDYPTTQNVRLVCDNLNTHSLGALYAAFEPESAHSLARRLEIIPTPKHGSWLNICNVNQKGVQWQFTCEKARIKLHALYPVIK